MTTTEKILLVVLAALIVWFGGRWAWRQIWHKGGYGWGGFNRH